MTSSSARYFNSLNYTLANEDTGLEVEMIRRLDPQSILSVCGSGGRALPLLVKGAKNLVCADLVQEQLWLARLREALFRRGSREDFLRFFGLPPFDAAGPQERKEIFERLSLDSEVRSYFVKVLSSNNWETLVYDGKWEKTFEKISRIVRTLAGPSILELFECLDLASQNKWYHSRFSHFRWSLVLAFVGNATFFNALLYKGHFVRKNIPESHYAFYREAFRKIFTHTLARDNFFAQVAILGKIQYSSGVPVEADPKVFEEIHTALLGGSSVEYLKGDLVSLLRKGDRRFDFVSFSDVPSYFSGETEREFLQWARVSLNPGATVIIRSYLHVPERLDTTGFRDVTSEWSEALAREKTQMYRVQILRYEGSKT